MQGTVSIWPEWKIENLIGEGSYGKVYKVRRENPGRVEHAALKVIDIPKDDSEIRTLLANGMDQESIVTYYQMAANDLFSEIKIMESLRSAPNVVTLQDARLEKKENGIGWTIYIRMELLTSMEDYLQGRKLTVEEVMKLGTDICSAISSCEKAHIIHRDIKPQNIFVNDFGDFKLGDFGIARQLERTGSMHSMKGTSMYMAPEVVKGLGYDHTVDIYSLGIMLYRFLNHGRAPFYPAYPKTITPADIDIATYKKNNGEQMPAPEEADEEQTRIILKACSYNPSERYQSAESLKDDLLIWQLKIRKKQESADVTAAVEKTAVLIPNEQNSKKENNESNNRATKPEVIQLVQAEKQPSVRKDKPGSAKPEKDINKQVNNGASSSAATDILAMYEGPTESAGSVSEQQKKEERNNEIYFKAIAHMRENRISECEKAIRLFETIPGWKDSEDQISICKSRIRAIRAEQQEWENRVNNTGLYGAETTDYSEGSRAGSGASLSGFFNNLKQNSAAKYASIGLAVIAVFVTVTGLSGKQNSSAENQPVAETVQPEVYQKQSTPAPTIAADTPAPASVPLQYDSTIWTLQPCINAEHVAELYAIYDNSNAIFQEHLGYPQQWNSKYAADTIAVYESGKYGIYDYNGNCLLPACLDTLAFDSGRSLFYGSYNGKNYILSYDLKSLTEKKNPVSATDDTTTCVIYNGQFGHVTGEDVGTFVPQNASELSLQNRNLVAELDGAGAFQGWHLMDAAGKFDQNVFYYMLYPLSSEYYYAIPFANSVFYVMDDNSKIAAIEADGGTFLTDFAYDEVKIFEEGYAPVMKNGKWGFIDMNGREVTDFMFDEASTVYQGKAYVKFDGYLGILNLTEAIDKYGYLKEEGMENSYTYTGEVSVNKNTPAIVSNPDRTKFPEDIAEYASSDINTGNTTVQFQVQVITDNLNIRKEPSTGAEIVGKCRKGDTYNVINSYLDDTYAWCQIGDGMWIADLNNQYLKLVE